MDYFQKDKEKRPVNCKYKSIQNGIGECFYLLLEGKYIMRGYTVIIILFILLRFIYIFIDYRRKNNKKYFKLNFLY